MIPIDRIWVSERVRSLSPAHVQALAESIAEVGLLQPIVVVPASVPDGGVFVDGYDLIAGNHRLEACKSLGLAEIEAIVADMPELDRQLAEIDENLIRAELSPAERAEHTARRKQIYIARHPETRPTSEGGRNRRQLGDDDRFTSDTAERTGQSERSVQRDATRGEQIPSEVLHLVAGTELDKGNYLDELRKAEDKSAKARTDLKRIKEAGKPVVSSAEASERRVNSAVNAFNKLSEAERAEFHDRISGPVFDRTEAGR